VIFGGYYDPDWFDPSDGIMLIDGYEADRVDISSLLSSAFGGGTIAQIRIYVEQATSVKFNYFKLCANAGAAPMPAP